MLLVLGLVFLVSCETTETEDVTKVKIYGNFDTFVPYENHVAQLIKELTGVEVDYDFLPQDPSLANSKLYLDIAGQAQYHLLKLAPEQFNQLRGVGALLDLTELIEKYAPNIKNSVSEEVWKTATFNGKIYGVPQQNPTNNLNMALFLRKDLFVENGISLPETLTQFKDSLIVTGRCISASHEANASLRVTPSAMALGEAAGVLAAFSAKLDVMPRDVDYREVQKQLIKQGQIIKKNQLKI